MSKPHPSLEAELKEIEFWQGTDNDPIYPEDVYGSLPDDVINQILKVVAKHLPKEDDREGLTSQTVGYIQGWNDCLKQMEEIINEYPTKSPDRE